MLWSFANANRVQERFFDLAAAAVAQRLDLNARQMATALWAFSRARPKHVTTRVLVLSLLPKCAQSLHALTPYELSLTAMAAARAFGGGAGGPPQAARRAPVPSQVAEF